MAKANLISAALYFTGAIVSAAALSSSSTSTRRMSKLELELHDEAERLESEARHIRRLERVERNHGYEVDELHRLRKEKEEEERLRKEAEAEEKERIRREHDELVQLRHEVAVLRRENSNSSNSKRNKRPIPPTIPYATVKESETDE